MKALRAGLRGVRDTKRTKHFSVSSLTKRHPDYSALKEQFLEKWVKPEPVNGVSVKTIFEIDVSETWRKSSSGSAVVVSAEVRMVIAGMGYPQFPPTLPSPDFLMKNHVHFRVQRAHTAVRQPTP